MDKKVDFNMLTSSRKRYNKETGESWYDRLFAGALIKNESPSWLKNTGAVGDLVYVFQLGSTLSEKNIVFVHNKKAGILYVNNKITGGDFTKYTNFYKTQIGDDSVETVDFLPTKTAQSRGRGPIDNLDDAIARAMVVDF